MSHRGSNSKQQPTLVDRLCKSTHFCKAEVEHLLREFKCVCNKNMKIDRVTFRDILHNRFSMTDDMIMDRVFKVFDRDNDQNINQEEWVRGLSCFIRGEKDEVVKFCFDVYDINGDSVISRDEMYQWLKPSFVNKDKTQTTEEDPDEGVKDLVELALKKLDMDHDNRVSFKDFTEAYKCDSLLLESFGSCLPSDDCICEFEQGLKKE